MTTDQGILFGIFAGFFIVLLSGKWRYDLVAFLALLVGVITGVVKGDDAFSGFGHPATVVVALVLVVSAGLVRSGAVFLITRTMIDATRSIGAHIAIMGGVGAVLSAFMNNVAALALLMPVDMQTARKAGRNPGATLMPLSFATILGGMVTLIGTPPNIIIASVRGEATGEPFKMFDFAPVGGITALVGLIFVAIVGWRLIPAAQKGQGASEQLQELSDYIAELLVPEDSALIGQRLHTLYAEAEKADVAIIGMSRDGKRLHGTARNAVIKAEDALVLEASPDSLDEFRTAMKLEFTDATGKAQGAAGDGLELVEMVVPDGSRITGRSATTIGLRWRKRAVLLGISRQGKRITKRVRSTEIQAGDILLVLIPSDARDDIIDWLGCLPLRDRGLSVTQDSKTWVAIGVFAAAVLAASVGWLYLPIALGVVVVAYVLLKILPLADIYDHIEWPVVVLLGSMIPLGAALDDAGGTQLIANALLGLTAGLPAWAVLAVLMAVTMTLSDVLNNTATTIVAAPVAISMANSLDASADPFLMAVAVAASCAFLTPIGHKNNTLVLGPGGYGFWDYWRMGLPLEILVLVVSIPAILVFWPL